MIIEFETIFNKKNKKPITNTEKAIVFTIESNDRREEYCCIANINVATKAALEKAANDFLVRNCFCDNYKIIDVKVASTEEENALLEMIRNGMSEFEASENICYSEDGSLRELIKEWNYKENDKKEVLNACSKSTQRNQDR